MKNDSHQNDKTRTHVVLSKGTMVSHYRIIEKIGAGGMGEVYLAQDTRLDRQIALKFLPTHLVSDENAKTRFTREARATAALKHPNIVTIHEVDEFNGRPYFAMEHIEGRSLRDLIKDEELASSQVIDIAIQVCEGLEKAHQSGVIHRDIKPSNIVIDADGRPRLLDFGLAAVQGVEKLTKTGSTLGTINYMSPEQVRGEEVDHRSDLFSLGIVLYEMITGRLPFKGDTEVAAMNSVLNDPPEPLSRYKSGVSDGFQRIVDKALAANQELRYQHADEMRTDLRREGETLSHPSRDTVKTKTAVTSSNWIWGFALIAVAVIVVIVFVWTIPDWPPERIVPRSKQVTFTGDAVSCAISPDGTYLAYASGTQMTRVRVMVRDISGGQAIQVFEAKMVTGMRWSPDGTELLVTVMGDSPHGIFLIPRFGGTPRSYPVDWGLDICWSPDGTRFAILYGQEYVLVDKESGKTTNVSCDDLPGKAHDFDWSTQGELALVSTSIPSGFTLWALRIDGSGLTRLADASSIQSPRWSPNGEAIYYLQEGEQGRALMKLPRRPGSTTERAEPTLLLPGLKVHKTDQISLSADASRLLYVQRLSWSNLWLFQPGPQSGFANGSITQLTAGTSFFSDPCISPDGRRVAFSMSAGEDTHIYTMPLNGGGKEQLTHTGRSNFSPAWSPDGDQIVYKSLNGGTYGLSLIDAGGGSPNRIAGAAVREQLLYKIAWSPGADILYYPSDKRGLHILDPQTGKQRPLVANGAEGMLSARYSPDGHRVAVFWSGGVTADDEGVADRGIWTISLEDPSPMFIVRGGMVSPLGWSADEQWIYFMDWDTNTICRVPTMGGDVDIVATLPFANIDWVDMTADGRQFICQLLEGKSDVWAVEDFDGNVD